MKSEDSLRVELMQFRARREASVFAMNKGSIIYFLFLSFAVLGVITKSINLEVFLSLVLIAFLVLLTSCIPLMKSMASEHSVKPKRQK